MPTIRRRIGRPLIRGQMPPGAAWWLQNGRSLSISEALDLGLAERDAWQASALHYGWPIAARSTFWARQDLRAAGYGDAIDAHVAAGRCPPDGWRNGPTAAVVPFPRGP
jgi:hypothetical protein